MTHRGRSATKAWIMSREESGPPTSAQTIVLAGGLVETWNMEKSGRGRQWTSVSGRPRTASSLFSRSYFFSRVSILERGFCLYNVSMSFTVKQERFEGPLELLLDLIEKRKLFVNDVSMAKVADDYIAYVRNLGDFPVADSAQFVLIASTLLLIKSKSLLPTLSLTTEEQANIEDLEKRLALLARMRDLAQKIKPLFGARILYPRGDIRRQPVFSPDADMTTANILDAARRTLNNLPKKEFLPKVIVDKVISLEEMIGSLTERIGASLKMSFREFSGGASKGERVNVIVSFLAMLELVKQGVIAVAQENHFDDIHMETESVGVPRY